MLTEAGMNEGKDKLLYLFFFIFYESHWKQHGRRKDERINPLMDQRNA